MNRNIVEEEAIEICTALEDRINIINKHIHESYEKVSEVDLNYWKRKLAIAQSAQNKMKFTILLWK